MGKNKFNAKIKKGQDGSKSENRYFNVLRGYEFAKYIKDLVKLENKDSYVVLDEFEITKNGRKSRVQARKFKPDFKFYTLRDLELAPGRILPANKQIILEYKSYITAKQADYSLRKTLFLKHCLEPGMIFVEVIKTDRTHTITTHWKRG